jgi:hypothetical protein
MVGLARGPRGQICCCSDIGQVSLHIRDDISVSVQEWVRVTAIEISHALNDLVVPGDRLPKDADLAILFDRVSCSCLHQHVLFLGSNMLFQVLDVIQRSGEEVLQFRERHLVHGAVPCFRLIQDGARGDRFEAVRGWADCTL